MPSKSALRDKRGKKWVQQQIAELCQVIAKVGRPGPSGTIVTNFGVMFETYLNISDTLVGTLQRAKKKNLVEFGKEMLWQGRDDHVVISLTRKGIALSEGSAAQAPAARGSLRPARVSLAQRRSSPTGRMSAVRKASRAAAMRLGLARKASGRGSLTRTDAARNAVKAAAALIVEAEEESSSSSSEEEESWEEVLDEEGNVFNYTGQTIGAWAEVVNEDGYAFWFNAQSGASTWETPVATGGGVGGYIRGDDDSSSSGGESSCSSSSGGAESEAEDVRALREGVDDAAEVARARKVARESLIPDLGAPPSFDADRGASASAPAAKAAPAHSYHATRRGTSLFGVEDLPSSDDSDDGDWNVWVQGKAEVLPEKAQKDLSAWRAKMLDR
jgi:hypothetical protein